MTLNIGQRFENWVANNSNYNKLLSNQPVENFDFVNQDISKLPASQKPVI